MNNKFSLFFFFLIGISNSIHAISPTMPKTLALSSFAIGSVYSGLGSTINISAQRFGATILGSAAVYYISELYTPYNKFAAALRIKKNVEANRLFKARKCNNITWYEIINMQKGKYPFLHAIKSLYDLFTNLEEAHNNVVSAIADLPGDSDFKQKCKYLASQIRSMQREIKICAQRIIHTLQWYREINKNNACFILQSEYIASVAWSLHLIGSLEASFEIYTYKPRDYFVTTYNLSFSPIFFNSLVDVSN